MDNLSPCPFCGGEARLTGHKAPEFWVTCDKIGCKASTEAFGSKEKAIAAWNTRTKPDAMQAEIERLRSALEFYADPEIYTPHPHGPAFDDRDRSFRARAALTGDDHG